ncbi:MAG: LexA family transcriptional regulator, partial [Firmicutes bacterium]|nr:LexA family transcriptional regulator [Bacillota bacterium]
MPDKKNNSSLPAGKFTAFPAPQAEALRFGALLKERRKKARLSQSALAELMHVTRNTVINWEADRSRPDYTMLPALCTFLNIRLHELFRMEAENSLTPLEDRCVTNLRRLSPSGQRIADKLLSTLVDEELREKGRELKGSFAIFPIRPGTLAAGTGSNVPEEPPEPVFLRKNQLNSRADGIALVSGCSMEPVYHSGDYVYYREASCADPGEDVVVDTDEGAVIKRVDDDHTLYSVNPAFPYPKKHEQNTLVIRGV